MFEKKIIEKYKIIVENVKVSYQRIKEMWQSWEPIWNCSLSDYIGINILSNETFSSGFRIISAALEKTDG